MWSYVRKHSVEVASAGSICDNRDEVTMHLAIVQSHHIVTTVVVNSSA